MSVGMGYSSVTIKYDEDDGTVSDKGLADYISTCVRISFLRIYWLQNLMCPPLIRHAVFPADRRYLRNVTRLKQEL